MICSIFYKLGKIIFFSKFGGKKTTDSVCTFRSEGLNVANLIKCGTNEWYKAMITNYFVFQWNGKQVKTLDNK